MLLNIDYLQDQIFKNKLRFGFMKNWNIHFDLGVYADKDNHVVGNTQYNYYLLQDNRFLKKVSPMLPRPIQRLLITLT